MANEWQHSVEDAGSVRSNAVAMRAAIEGVPIAEMQALLAASSCELVFTTTWDGNILIFLGPVHRFAHWCAVSGPQRMADEPQVLSLL